MPRLDSKRNDLLQELALAIREQTKDGEGQHVSGYITTAIKGFTILRSERSMQPFHRISNPALWISVQGGKWAVVGKEDYRYSAGQALLITVEAPCRCTIPKASPQQPFLGLVIELARSAILEMLEALDISLEAAQPAKKGNALVVTLDEQLLDCALRSVRLLSFPPAIPLLYPGIMREISYWLLSGPHGNQAARIAMTKREDQRVLEAVRHLRARFRQAIRIGDLAGAAGMSPATFHRQFRAATSLSPLQYQKQLRLLEARRLMISGQINIEKVALRVGYASLSQFSREYTRMFHKTPREEISTQHE